MIMNELINNVFQKLFRFPEKIRTKFYMKYNCVKFQLIGIEYSKGLSVCTHIHIMIKKGAQILLGENVHITSGDNTNPLSRIQRGCLVAERENAIIKIGNNVGISSSCIWAKESITIGNYVNIGADCVIIDSDAHSLDWKIRMIGGVEDITFAQSSPVIIEDHAFIGTRSIILKGVTIGARSIIAAGSVVTKSIPPDCIAGGNPCKVIKE